MRTFIANAARIACNTFIAAVIFGLATGGAAVAGGLTFQQRVEAEMNQGKDYAAAVIAANHAGQGAYSGSLVREAHVAETALNSGKDYQDAWHAAGRFEGAYTEAQVAESIQVQRELREGKDYVAASEAAQRQRADRGAPWTGATRNAKGEVTTSTR